MKTKEEAYEEAILILKELKRVGGFYQTAIDIDIHEKPSTDGEEIEERISKVLSLISESE